MKIAITGASGKLGSAVIRELNNQKGPYEIIGIARTPEKVKNPDCELRKADFSDNKLLENALEGVEVLLLISGNDYPEKRIGQHRNVINAAVNQGVRRIVYSSIIGDPEKTRFKDIVKSNRQTEDDVIRSGMEWVIGRNGLYIEPDLEAMDEYLQSGNIMNAAGNGKCAYTSRKELAVAYKNVILNPDHNGKVYNLAGTPVSQHELVEAINRVYGTNLRYEYMDPEAFTEQRKSILGELYGNIVGGIYHSIQLGIFNVDQDFEKAAGRPHQTLDEMIST